MTDILSIKKKLKKLGLITDFFDGNPFSEIHTSGINLYFANNYTVDLIKLKSMQLSSGKQGSAVLLFIPFFR